MGCVCRVLAPQYLVHVLVLIIPSGSRGFSCLAPSVDCEPLGDSAHLTSCCIPTFYRMKWPKEGFLKCLFKGHVSSNVVCWGLKKRVVRGAAGAERKRWEVRSWSQTAPPDLQPCLCPLRSSQVTKVKTDRPLPENPYHSRARPEPNPEAEGELKPAKHGSRLFFWTM